MWVLIGDNRAVGAGAGGRGIVVMAMPGEGAREGTGLGV